MVTIRRFRREDAEELAAVIAATLRETNGRDYSPEYIEKDVQALSADKLVDRAAWQHLYVACAQGRIIGCGAIGPYWGREEESSLFTLFVLPAWQGKGVGRQIVQRLETDEYFLRARRIEVPAFVTAVGFYQKRGYAPKTGVPAPDEEGLCRMEKHRDMEKDS